MSCGVSRTLFQEAMRLLPDDLEVQHSFGDVLYYGGKIQAAKRQWEKACALLMFR